MRARMMACAMLLSCVALTAPVVAQQAQAPLRDPDVIFVPTPAEVVTRPGEVYRLSASDGVRDDHLAALEYLRGVPGFKSLDLSRSKLLTDAGVDHDIKVYPAAGHGFLNNHAPGETPAWALLAVDTSCSVASERCSARVTLGSSSTTRIRLLVPIAPFPDALVANGVGLLEPRIGAGVLALAPTPRRAASVDQMGRRAQCRRRVG